MSAFGGKADMTGCGSPLSRSLLGAKRTWRRSWTLPKNDNRRRRSRGSEPNHASVICEISLECGAVHTFFEQKERTCAPCKSDGGTHADADNRFGRYSGFVWASGRVEQGGYCRLR